MNRRRTSSRKVSADDMLSALPLLYGVEVGSETSIQPDFEDLYSRSKIDRNDLDGEMTEQAALYAWWATLAAEADFEVDRCQRALDIAEAEVVSRLRGEGQPATTIHDLRKGQPEYVEANDAWMIARRAAAIIRAQVRSLEHRREMITALAHRRNREFDSARDSV